MKIKIIIFTVIILLLAQACTPVAVTIVALSPSQAPILPTATGTAMPEIPEPMVETTLPQIVQITPVISTAVSQPDLATLPPPPEETETPPPGRDSIPGGVITLHDGGRTFSMRVGDSFLLNLGSDMYEWDVSVDNENVLKRELGIAVIQGAQGVYKALGPGTATLSALGDPFCLKSTPACGMPSILFTVTVLVE